MRSEEIRKKFIAYFKKKGHVQVPSSSLLSDDPSVLLTTAGVQQFKPYYTGARDPEIDFHSRRIVSVQKSFRTTDIDQVGDETHNTFFEMLGNFSFGDYQKKEALRWAYEFLTSDLAIDPKRITVTIFEGNKIVSRDEESYTIWHKDIGLSKDNIRSALWDNFWGPTGNQGPCGPTSEIYIDGVEVWNIVFNEYFCQGSREQLIAGTASLEKLKQSGIDTGMGLERLAKSLQQTPTIFETDLFQPLMKLIPDVFSISQKRILADHARGITFLVADGIRPSNKEAGYILRRLMRRATVIVKKSPFSFKTLINQICLLYKNIYPELNDVTKIKEIYIKEVVKFEKTLEKGLRELEKCDAIDASAAFKLFETYGLPYEVIKDVAGDKASMLITDAFDREFAKHQDISRAGLEKKFGGHGLILDTGEMKASNDEEVQKVTRLHTATHLLQQALKEVLGDDVRQKGSDINANRLRFDFSFDRKVTDEEIACVQEKINSVICRNLPVHFIELSLDRAKKMGALYLPERRYPDPVKMYYVGDSIDSAYSKELCGGPHVTHTGDIGKVTIMKEESVGSGVRRIRASVE